MRVVKNNRYALLLGALFSLACLTLSVSFSPVESAPPVYRDMVRETTTTTGTGTLTLAGASAGYQSFATAGLDGLTVTYRVSVSGGAWEVSDGVFTASGGTLTRGKFRASSTGSRVSLPSGTKTVDVVFSAADAARVGNFVDVANYATAGAGTIADPWTGWDTAITWAANTTYRFRTGYYSYATSPNFALDGIQLIGEAGVFLQHTGRGIGFNLNGAATASVRVENLHLLGNYTAGTGTISYSSGSMSVVGVGTHFTTECAVGDAVSTNGGTADVESHLITAITDDTHLTVDANWVSASGGQLACTIGTTANGYQVTSLFNSLILNCAARNVNGHAIDIKGCLGTTIQNFRCTHDDPTWHQQFQVKPQWGAVIDTNGGSAFTTTTWFFNANFDYFQTGGVWIKSTTTGCQLNGVICESATGPATGFLVDGVCNSLISCWAEGITSGTDCKVSDANSANNQFINCVSTNLTTIAGSLQQVIGGRFNTLTISGTDNQVIGAAVTTGSATYTDNGAGTVNLGIRTYINGFRNYPATLGAQIQSVVVSGSSGTFTIDAFAGNLFRSGISADTAIANPTNSAAGQTFYLMFYATVANKNLTWGNNFNPVGVTLPTTVGAQGTVTWVGPCIYNDITAKWDVIGVKP